MVGNVLSWRSEDSILSIGSKGSILSIGSVGSVLSIGSAGSFASAFSIGSFASVGSALSGLSTASLLSWRSRGGVLAAGVRVARRELGVEQRAAQRHGTAEHPGGDEFPVAADVSGHDRGRLEDARADDHAADEYDTVPEGQQLLGRYRLVLIAVQGRAFL